MKNSPYVGIGGVYSERDRSARFRVSKNRDRCEDKGGVEIVGP